MADEIDNGDDVSELECAIIPMARGRRGGEIDLAVVRGLTAQDLEKIGDPGADLVPLSPIPEIKELKFQHHRIASAIARGAPLVEISLDTGYSPAYISTLQRSPDFAELVAYYQEQGQELLVEAGKKLTVLGITAMEELQVRLNDNPDKLQTRTLLEIVDTAIVAPKKNEGAQGRGAAAPPVQFNVQFVTAPAAGVASAPLIDQETKEFFE